MLGNREIKFRAWDTSSDGMMIWGDILMLDADGLLPFITILEEPERYKVMQYTGLKDKNGKEIYEGDVWAEGESLGIIVFVEDGFEIDWKHNPESWSETLRYHHKNGSVQGSIFEHPHLLKEESHHAQA